MTEFALNSNIQIAEKSQRLVNYVVDRFLISIFSSLFSLFFIFSNLAIKETSFLFIVIYTIIHILYYFIFELSSGQTIGKKITKTKVIRKGTGKINFFNIFIRTFTRLIFLDVYSYLFGNEIGMHDILSNTLVVKSSCKRNIP